MARTARLGVVAAALLIWAACHGGEGDSASMSDSNSEGSGSGGETTTTGESDAGSASESDSTTTSGGTMGQTNTTDLSGSISDSNSGSTTDTDTQGNTGSTSATESGGGTGGTSTTTTTTGDPINCADYMDEMSCNADANCKAILGVKFEYIVSAWCLGDHAFLGCVDIGEMCGGEPYVVCVGDEQYQITNQCPPPDAMVCDPPPGGPDFANCP